MNNYFLMIASMFYLMECDLLEYFIHSMERKNYAK